MPQIAEALKTCTCCNIQMPKSNFHSCAKMHDSLKYFCRDCTKEKQASYYAKNAETLRADARIRAAVAREADRGKHRQQRCDWAKANRPKVTERKRQRRSENLDEQRRKACAYVKARESRDVKFKLSNRVASLMRISLGCAKGEKWETIVRYTRSELKSHLERQFSPGMSWSNYGRGDGKWQIDHIIPISRFNFSSADDPEFLACWALTNLRPLWAIENMSKGNKRTVLL